MATLSDVAALAGVSVSAVSRVLSEAPSTRVRPETRERIKKAAEQLEYRPNFAGRALKFARSNVIALIVPDLTNAVFTELMRGVEDAAIQRDYVVLLGRAEDMQPGGRAITKLIGEGRVDGMLVQLSERVAGQDLKRLIAAPAPVIFINSIQEGHVGSVNLQDEAGSKAAVDHLAGLGHTSIAMAGGTAATYSAARRERGFREAMAARGLEVSEDAVMRFGYTPEQGRQALRRLLELEQRPTALYVANVNAAIGVLAEARRLAVRIPEDLSVVAMHDVWTVENTWPPLTTVKMPLYELGQRAAGALFDRLGGAPSVDIVVDESAPELIVRESTAPPLARHWRAGSGKRSV